jgi:CheY-like chemotaxis protein
VHLLRWPRGMSGPADGHQPGCGISGWELARQIREITPGFPVVYMTSASAPDWQSQGVDGSVLIQKPFAPAQLAAAVSQLLGGATSPG